MSNPINPNEGGMDVIRDIRAMFTPSDPFAVTVVRGDVALDLADRLEAAWKRDILAEAWRNKGIEDALCAEIDARNEKIATMHAALVKVKKLFDGRLMFQPAIRECHEMVNAALTAVGSEK